MNKNALMLIVIFTLFSQFVNSAVPIIEVDREFLKLKLNSENFYYLYDESASQKLSDIRSILFSGGDLFSKIEREDDIENYDNGYYWFVFSIKNNELEKRSLIYEFDHVRIDPLNVYVLNSRGELLEQHLTGNFQPYQSRPIKDTKFKIPITVDANETAIVCLQVGLRAAYVPTKSTLWDRDHLMAQGLNVMKEHYLSWGITCILIFLVIYNLCLGIYTQDLFYLYFMIYLTSEAFQVLAITGYGHQLLWPNNGWFEERLIGYTIVLSAFSISFFSLKFINLQKYNKKAELCGHLIMALAVLLALIHTIYPIGDHLFYASATAVVLPYYIWLWYISLKLWREENQRTAKYYCISWAPVLLSLIASILARELYGADITIIAQFGGVAQAIMLSFAVAAHVTNQYHEQLKNEAQSQAKNRFLAKMSHELRTPMTGVIGVCDLLNDTALNSEQRQYTSIIRSSGHTLLAIINDILDFSKIEAGKMEVEHRSIDFHNLLFEVSSLFRSNIEEKPGISFYCDIAPDVSTMIVGDSVRLRQILMNLLSNAFKFTSEGEICVLVKRSDTTSDLIIEVRDTGIGMTPEEQSKIFSAFQQANSSTARHYGGTGLGLAICKQLVELMAGSIQIRSVKGEGSVYTLCLPLLDENINPDPPEPHHFLDKQVVLFSDDPGFINRLESHIKTWGLESERVHRASTNDFHETLHRVLKNPKYAFVLVDAYHSSDLVQSLFQLDQNDSVTVPVVILTHVKYVQSAKEFDAKHTCCYERPYMVDNVLKYLLIATGVDPANAVIKGGETTNNGGLPISETEFTQDETRLLKVLVAEDNHVNQMLIKKVVQKLGHEVTVVEDGKQALDIFVANNIEGAPAQAFDIILMDYEMPVLNGIEATEEIRAIERANNHDPLPIVALTAHVLPEFLDACEECGMTSILTKPLSQQELYRELSMHSSGT